MGFLRNRPKFLSQHELQVRQVEGVATAQYREFVWALFRRIVNSTPQWSGKAVANWNLSVGAPDYSFNSSYGDPTEIVNGNFEAPHEKGDRKWINHCLARNRPVYQSIRYRDKVYITNNTTGDPDGVFDGDGAYDYLEALQNSDNWLQRLRAVNKPYETVQESVIVVETKFFKGGGVPRVVGADWSN